MPCDIVVYVKQVPHPDYPGKISLNPTRGTMNREEIPAVINPGDRNALEEALSILEIPQGFCAVTITPPRLS